MNPRSLINFLLLWFLSGITCFAQPSPVENPSDMDIPHLRKQGTATQLIVDGKPFLMLAGELGNNTATNLDYLNRAWPKIVDTKLNSVLAAVSWAQIEPEEGKFDFQVLDGVIDGARQNNLRLVFLWFGSWKNGHSTYAPDWVKKDYKRFPRVKNKDGESIEVLTPFSNENRDADARAFTALMKHVKEVDGQKHTVIMVQVENEIFGRDHSALATKAYQEKVPGTLMDYLKKHKEILIPELQSVWENAGFKTSGTWEEVFGKSVAADEIFMAWYFSSYVGRITSMGKAEYRYQCSLTHGDGLSQRKGKTQTAPRCRMFSISGRQVRHKSTSFVPIFMMQISQSHVNYIPEGEIHF